MNWQQWSEQQAAQILELRQRVKAARKLARRQAARAELWRTRALDKTADTDRRRWYGP